MTEHHAADFHAPDARLAVQLDGQGNARELQRGDLRTHGRGVDVHGMSAGRLHDRNAGRADVVTQVGRRGDAVLLVVRLERFVQAYSHGVEVPPSQPAVRRKALSQYQEVPLLCGEAVVIRRQEAADVRHPVLLGRHRRSVGVGEDLTGDVDQRRILVPVFTLLDEVRVLGETTRVDVERYIVRPADLGGGANVGHRNGLATAGVVGDRDHCQRDPAGRVGQHPLQGLEVDVALERPPGRKIRRLLARQVQGFGPREFDVGTRRIEVRVVRNHVPGAAHGAEQDSLRGPSLVGRNHVSKTEDVLYRILETVITVTSRVRLVAAHDSGPLLGAHRTGAAVCQQIDEDVTRLEAEHVVACLADMLLPLVAGGHSDRLHALDSERLDHRVDRSRITHCLPTPACRRCRASLR